MALTPARSGNQGNNGASKSSPGGRAARVTNRTTAGVKNGNSLVGFAEQENWKGEERLDRKQSKKARSAGGFTGSYDGGQRKGNSAPQQFVSQSNMGVPSGGQGQRNNDQNKYS